MKKLYLGLVSDRLLAYEEWTESAMCAQTDPERFFPELGGTAAAARKVCAQCQVRAECLDYALRKNEPYGVWGGLTRQERSRMQRSS
ncbi:WhiB family transcriptional regulator [Streptomyces sp. NPDC048506]|uniref:WhiB family transcriptional regulator n=1 Tax=Streptomyces sp. NPDC048506 TaxID=3155028 RepID=UPI0034428A46